MLQTEFIRSMHCNYERVLLDKQPEEKKYQYCILSRGGIKGLLPCSLRYLNGFAYLYYDITSKQSITQLYGKRCITREWLKDFMWSFSQLQTELGRFLLDERNVLWYPEQIFQDLESNIFSFLYIPYYEEENSFLKFLEYLVEHLDYEDEVLVECVYKMYEQCERNGDVYLQAQIFEDAKLLNAEKYMEGPITQAAKRLNRDYSSSMKMEYEKEGNRELKKTTNAKPENVKPENVKQENVKQENTIPEKAKQKNAKPENVKLENAKPESAVQQNAIEQAVRQGTVKQEDSIPKKGIRYLFDGKRRKNKGAREDYQRNMQLAMEGYAVAEEISYGQDNEEEEETFGRTVYIEEARNLQEVTRRLYTLDGRIIMQLTQETCTIGKKKDEVDLVLDDFSVSRMHARISWDKAEAYLEDLNSTNGTYKNGLRLQPYEKKKLEQGDEIRIGKVVLTYR